MDPRGFDTLARAWAGTASRRGLSRGVGALVLGGLLGPLRTQDQSAAKHHKKHKKKHQSPPSPPGCTRNCAGKACDSDGCGGTCGTCTGGASCQGGTCVCPSSQRDCQGQCIPTAQCCLDADCGAGKGCFAGSCLTRQGICPTGADYCAGTASSSCGDIVHSCACLTTMQGQTRCGAGPVGGCDGCTSDAQCAGRYPAITGAFCAQGGGPTCSTCASFCFEPCPV